MRAVLLAGGSGSRLFPTTLTISKHLLPLYDKPLIYYALDTLIATGIEDILLISTARDLPLYQALLGTGADFGIHLHYHVQDAPRGIAHALALSRHFINGHPCCLLLGDNFFYGTPSIAQQIRALSGAAGAQVFAKAVADPTRFGVVAFDDNKHVSAVIEKPNTPPSPYAVTGCYVFDTHLTDYLDNIPISARGEQEITHVLNRYAAQQQLHVHFLTADFIWQDTGTAAALLATAQQVQALQQQTGHLIGAPEWSAYQQQKISRHALESRLATLKNSDYAHLLWQQLHDEKH